MQEFPKWVRHPGKPDVLVDTAESEARQHAEWAAEAPVKPIVNALLSTAEPPSLPQLDHDQNGEPGGSTKPTGDDLPALRATYKEKFGKRAFPGWDAETLKTKLEADA